MPPLAFQVGIQSGHVCAQHAANIYNMIYRYIYVLSPIQKRICLYNIFVNPSSYLFVSWYRCFFYTEDVAEAAPAEAADPGKPYVCVSLYANEI